MIEHDVNKLDNFISGWYIDPIVCDDIIDFFKNTETKIQGMVGTNKEGIKEGVKVVDKSKKDCIECSFIGDYDLSDRYYKELQKCVNLYVSKYTFANDTSIWRIIQNPNIQHYNPNSAFFIWHTERSFYFEPNVSRHLVFTTYLNDVTDAGQTEFYYQKLKVKPEKGLTIIWPTDWTFTHRGVPSPSQEKYILTGWFNFVS
jgi:hypothetical protein